MSNIDKSSKSFVAEAAIISVSNFAVKLVGVLFKIPLANQLGEFMGVFNAAYSIYAMLFMISTSGLPVAVSRLVAIAKEKGRRAEASQKSVQRTLYQKLYKRKKSESISGSDFLSDATRRTVFLVLGYAKSL